MIDNIDEIYIGILVHVMTDEFGILEDVISTVIQWLRVIIVLSKVHLHYPLIFYLPYINFLKWENSLYAPIKHQNIIFRLTNKIF